MKPKPHKCRCDLCVKWNPLTRRIMSKLRGKDRKLFGEFLLMEANQSDSLGVATAKLAGEWPGWEWMAMRPNDQTGSATALDLADTRLKRAAINYYRCPIPGIVEAVLELRALARAYAAESLNLLTSAMSRLLCYCERPVPGQVWLMAKINIADYENARAVLSDVAPNDQAHPTAARASVDGTENL